jgi:signal transduction histidine kinase
MATKKKAHRTTKQEEERLRQERLAYVGTLASGLAHEIRTPLNAIQMNIDLLAEELDAVTPDRRETFAKRVDRIGREARDLKRTLDAFLQFARPPKLQSTPLDIEMFLSELIEFFEPEAVKHQVAIVKEFQKGLYPVPIDPQQFGQVVLNLLTNAREAIESHGVIVVRASQTDSSVEIEIEDDGGGVKPDNEGQIFEIFFSTKEHGTGLGLGIARRIVEEHGGTLTLENHPGKGACFVVSLPRVKILEFVQDAIVPVRNIARPPAGATNAPAGGTTP